MAPEFRDCAVLSLFVSRVQSYRPGPQCVDEQAVGSAGAAGEQAVPRPPLAFDAAAAQKTNDRGEPFQINTPSGGNLLDPEEFEGSLQVLLIGFKRQPNDRELQPAEVIQEQFTGSVSHEWDVSTRDPGILCGNQGRRGPVTLYRSPMSRPCVTTIL